jgi:hypothetical protein
MIKEDHNKHVEVTTHVICMCFHCVMRTTATLDVVLDGCIIYELLSTSQTFRPTKSLAITVLYIFKEQAQSLISF